MLSPILLGSIASLLTGLSTAIGALPLVFTSKMSDKVLDASLGFSAGIMLAASSFSLLIPALEMGWNMGGIHWLISGSPIHRRC